MSKVLETKNLSINFSGLRALDNINISLNKNELVGLIGPNGAGKTTLFNIMTGVYFQTEGEYYLDNSKIINKKQNELVRMGVARTFQNIRLFNDLSVIENIKVALNIYMKYGYFSGALRLGGYWKEEKQIHEEALNLLKIFDMQDFADIPASSLSYGKQRELEIIRALATKPKILMLDEPAAGMNPIETENLMNKIKFIRDKFDITILLIEHDMKLVLGICERLIVLDQGKVIAEGNPLDVVNNPRVITAYLGKDAVKED